MRLDKALLFAICEDLRKSSLLDSQLVFEPNDTLYSRGDRYRFAQTISDQSRLTHRLVEVERSEYIDLALARASNGATVEEIVHAICSMDQHGNVSPEEARELARALIENQVLVSALTPQVTGEDPLNGLIEQLEKLPHKSAAVLADLLRATRQKLFAISARAPGVSPATYYNAVPTQEQLSAVMPLNLLRSWPEERLFQVDLVTSVQEARIAPGIAARLMSGAKLLSRVCGGRGRQTELERFRKAFVERYQDREVPLLAALDEDSGIDFTGEDQSRSDVSSGLEGLEFPAKPVRTDQWNKREQHLFRLACEAWTGGRLEIELGREDLDKLETDDPLPLPDALSVTATLIGSPAALRTGRLKYLIHYVDGPSGAKSLGRFCHIDSALSAAVTSHLKSEEALRPDTVYAEVVHLPQGRMANIVCRPVLRKHEICYLGRSGAADARQIAASDLLVSVSKGQVRLRSQSLHREVVPRMTTAHNPRARGLGIYQFLVALQHQGTSGASWTWGALSNAQVLPRISHGQYIFSLARWSLSAECFLPLRALSKQDRLLSIREIRRRWQVPQLVTVTKADQQFPLDLENLVCIDALLNIVGRNEVVVLQEALLSPEELCVQSPEGKLTHELIVPFVRRSSSAASNRPTRPLRSNDGTPSLFLPGSNWLEVRLYCGPMTGDRVLRSLVRPLASSRVELWFFDRKVEPPHYLRVRFRSEQTYLLEELVPRLHHLAESLVECGDLHRVTLDSYRRDRAAWGGPAGMELAERLQSTDSEMVLGLIGTEGADEGLPRWLLALHTGDRLLNDLGLDLEKKVELLGRLREAQFRAFRADRVLRRSIDRRYRANRSHVAAVLDRQSSMPSSPMSLATLLQRRSATIQRAVSERSNLEGLAVHDLAGALLRSHVNRVIPHAHAAHELLIYDHLWRNHSSQLAQKTASRLPDPT